MATLFDSLSHLWPEDLEDQLRAFGDTGAAAGKPKPKPKPKPTPPYNAPEVIGEDTDSGKPVFSGKEKDKVVPFEKDKEGNWVGLPVSGKSTADMMKLIPETVQSLPKAKGVGIGQFSHLLPNQKVPPFVKAEEATRSRYADPEKQRQHEIYLNDEGEQFYSREKMDHYKEGEHKGFWNRLKHAAMGAGLGALQAASTAGNDPNALARVIAGAATGGTLSGIRPANADTLYNKVLIQPEADRLTAKQRVQEQIELDKQLKGSEIEQRYAVAQNYKDQRYMDILQNQLGYKKLDQDMRIALMNAGMKQAEIDELLKRPQIVPRGGEQRDRYGNLLSKNPYVGGRGNGDGSGAGNPTWPQTESTTFLSPDDFAKTVEPLGFERAIKYMAQMGNLPEMQRQQIMNYWDKISKGGTLDATLHPGYLELAKKGEELWVRNQLADYIKRMNEERKKLFNDFYNRRQAGGTGTSPHPAATPEGSERRSRWRE